MTHLETALLMLGLASLGPAPLVSGEPPKAQPQPPVLERVGSEVEIALEPDPRELVREGQGVVWRRTLEVPGASFIKPHFVDLSLAPGEELRVRSATGRVVERLRGRGPKERGTFWGLSVPGSVLDLELTLRGPWARPPFRLDRVLAGDADLFAGRLPGPETICPPADFEDTICYQGDPLRWSNIVASAGVILAGGDPSAALFCSASNVSPLGMLLTNNHCIEDQAACDNAEFLFGYRRTGCGDGSPPSLDWQSFHCDQLVASSPFGVCEVSLSSLDFSLSSVIGDPSSTFGWTNPDPSPPASGEALYIVQHPSGRPQEIAHGAGSDVVVDGSTLRYYGTLDTEPGSSGSPIFRQLDGKLVGLHHCGTCSGPEGNRGMLMSDIYPAIAPFLCSASPSLQGIEAEGLAEVAGNGDGKIDPGETWQAVPRVRNASCSDTATNVVGTVQVGPGSAPGITLLDTALSIPGIAPGAVASGQPVRFVVPFDAACGGSLELDLIDLAADGIGPFPASPGIVSSTVGAIFRTTLFYESFAGGLPGAWTVVDGGTGTGPAATWTTANPGARMEPMAEPFAIVDSDQLGIGELMDEQLISPVVSAVGFSHVELQLSHDFNWYELGFEEVGDVQVRSAATGGAWAPVVSFAGADQSGTLRLEVSAQAAGASNVQVRFHYHDARFEWWWAVDDVFLLGHNGPRCDPFDPESFLFADGFETGDTSRWSQVVGASLLRGGRSRP